MRVELRDEAREDLVDGAWFMGAKHPGWMSISSNAFAKTCET
jgi:hypothetical protein